MSSSPDETSLDPTWQQILTLAIERSMLEMHTGLPGSVVAFDPLAGTVDVQPLLQRAFVDRTTGETSIATSPQVTRVPVMFYRIGPWRFVSKLRPGETVFLAFAERSIDAWLGSPPNTPTDPQDARHHHLSDAIAIPGLRTRAEPMAPIEDDLQIAHESGLVEIRLSDTAAHVRAPTIFLDAGGDADASIPRAEDLLAWLTSHTHTSAAPGSPTTPPVAPPPLSIASPAAKVR